MTHDEAIKLLVNIAAYDIDSQRGEAKFKALWMAIKALEQTRWIPTSERLPEEAERVLIYAERNAYDDKGKFRKKVIDIGWQVDGMWHIDGCSGVDGIAWMPLPKPYKAESEDKE